MMVTSSFASDSTVPVLDAHRDLSASLAFDE
jgi:hypothetical protein